MNSEEITIINYGMGNIGSIVNMLKRIGVKSHIAHNSKQIKSAKKLILPGVGAFDKAMLSINALEIREALDKKVLEECVPILGICLGMQLLTNGSEEGLSKGLGWIDGKASLLPADQAVKVPHMGWNTVRPFNESPLTMDLSENSRFYFVHSYCVHVCDNKHSIMKSFHGIEFDAVIQKNNIFGAQFHPEKSHSFGMQLLKNFAGL